MVLPSALSVLHHRQRLFGQSMWRPGLAEVLQMARRHTDTALTTWKISSVIVIVCLTARIVVGGGIWSRLFDIEVNKRRADVPQKIHLSDFWSRTFCKVGGSGSKSAILFGSKFVERVASCASDVCLEIYIRSRGAARCCCRHAQDG